MASSARIEELKKKFDENPRRYFAPLANEFRKLGDFDQAILICQEFLPQQPGHMSGHIVYGQALFEARRMDEARTVFETALTLDPENLIALRHLGDICRDAGDLNGARSWYRRVLDADPRNEEIAALLAGLDEPAAVTWTTATPTSSPTVDQAPSAPASWLADESVSSGARPEPIVEQPLETIPPQTEIVDFERVIASSTNQASASTVADDELLDLDASMPSPSGSAARGQDEAASMGIERAQETPFGFEPSQLAQSTGSARSDTLAGFESTSHDSEPMESARLVQDSISALELPPLDESFGVGNVPPVSTPAPPRVESRDAAEESTSVEATVFESFEMPIAESETSTASLAQAADAVEAHVTDAGSSAHEIIDEPIEIPAAPAPQPRTSGAAAAAAQPPAAGGFVTETMAELYVTQGHIAEAIGVYRQLVERYPGDEVLRARLEELQSMQSATDEAPAAPAADEALDASMEVEMAVSFGVAEEPLVEGKPPFDGPVTDEELETPEWGTTAAGADSARVQTIRDFLNELVSYQPYSATPESPNGSMPHTLPEPEAAAPASDEALAEEWSVQEEPEAGAWVEEPIVSEAAEEATPWSAPSDLEQPLDTARESAVGGSIDELFMGASVSSDDEAAAALLARAFDPAASEAEISGKPTRAAQDELSLDHVFRDRQANADRGQPTFSFDQFFSQDASDGGSGRAGEPSTGAGGPDEDIQQFNAWLEGLKKT